MLFKLTLTRARQHLSPTPFLPPFLSLFLRHACLCVHIHAWACLFLCMCMPVCVEGWSLTSGVFLCCFSLHLLRQSLSLSPDLVDSLNWMSSRVLLVSCFPQRPCAPVTAPRTMRPGLDMAARDADSRSHACRASAFTLSSHPSHGQSASPLLICSISKVTCWPGFLFFHTEKQHPRLTISLSCPAQFIFVLSSSFTPCHFPTSTERLPLICPLALLTKQSDSGSLVCCDFPPGSWSSTCHT